MYIYFLNNKDKQINTNVNYLMAGHHKLNSKISEY